MREITDITTMIAARDVGSSRSAKPQGMAELTPLHRTVIDDMPRGSRQEIRVLEAVLQPGDVTPRHSHRFPVTVYVTAGVFTLRLDDRPVVHVGAGEVFVEPVGVPMTGTNEQATELRMILFYVCDPDTPFADPA